MKKIYQRRYIGNKKKITTFIKKSILDNCTGESFCDLFGGTGSVSYSLLDVFKDIHVNDFLYSNFVAYKNFFSLEKEKIDVQKCKDLVSKWETLKEENYFSNNFKNTYYSYDDCIKIGNIRDNLFLNVKNKNINKEEFFWVLSSLLYSMDSSSRTVGHFEAYLKKSTYRKFNFEWNEFNFYPNVSCFNMDVFDYVKEMNNTDIVYLDPPYNSRQYDRAYHVLENVAKWNKPSLYGVAKKPEINEKTKSVFSTHKARDYFNTLINLLSKKSNYIVLSYNNTYNPKSSTSKNKISYDDIIEIMSSFGKLKILSENHKAFQTGKTELKKHKEYLFILKVRK